MSSSRKITLAALLMSALLVSPTQAQTGPSISALTLCAGAISAHRNIDVLTYPRGASGEWADVLGRILAQLNTMEGVEGMTGRYAASAARSYWNEQPRAARETAANDCRTRFGSN
jgi:hypothetical protein